MADNPDPKLGEVAVVIPVNDVPHAPFIFYEAAPAFGHTNEVINLTLSANRTCVWPTELPGTILSWSHTCAETFRRLSVCERRLTRRCCWPCQRRRA